MSSSPLKVSPTGPISARTSNLEALYPEIYEMNRVLAELESESSLSFQEKYTRLERITDSSLGYGIVCIDLSPDASLLAVGIIKDVMLWSMEKKICLCTLGGHKDEIRKISFSSNGEKIVTASFDTTCRIWDVKSQKQDALLEGHERRVLTAAFNHDASLVASGGADRKIVLWNVSNKTKLGELHGHEKNIIEVCFLPNGKTLASVSDDKTIRLWSVQEKKQIFMFPEQYNPIYSVAASPDGKYLATGTYQIIKLWNLYERVEGATLAGNEGEVWNMKFSSDSQYLVSSCQSMTKVKVWNIHEKREEFTLDCSSDIRSSTIGNDCRVILACPLDGNMYVWNLKESTAETTLDIHNQGVKAIAFSPTESLFATAGSDALVNIWNYETNSLYAAFYEHRSFVRSVCFTHDGKFIASTSFDASIVIMNIASKTREKRISLGFTGEALCFNDNSELLAVGGRGDSLLIYEWKNGKIFQRIPNEILTFAVLFDPTGKTLIYGGEDGKIRFWDIKANVLKNIIDAHSLDVSSLSLSADGNFLASGSFDRTVKVWNLTSMSEECLFKGHTLDVQGVGISRDGKYVASASEDKTVKVWNVIERREEFTMIGHTACIETACFNANRELLVSAGQDSTVKIWRLHEKRKTVDNETKIYATGYDRFQDFMSFYNATYNMGLKKYERISAKAAKILISKFHFSVMHFLAYLGLTNIIENFMKQQKFPIVADGYGHSPLFYSIKAKHQKITDLILDYIVSLAENKELANFEKSLYSLRNDFVDIISNSSSSLDKFLSYCMFNKIATVQFGVPIAKFPIIRMSPSGYPPVELFVYETNTKEKIPLGFRMSYFKLPSSIGSKSSIDFLIAVIQCKNKDIYRTQIIKFFAQCKWNSLMYWIYAYTNLLWLNLILLAAVINYFEVYLVVPFLVTNTILLAWEAVQFAQLGFSYFHDYWNLLDISTLTTTYVWVVLSFNGINSGSLSWVMCFFNVIRGLTGFRAFDNTRYYIKLIFKSLDNIQHFLLIFVYTTLSFGLLGLSSRGELISFKVLWMNAFGMLVGDMSGMEPDNMSIEYITFLIAVVINVILMLNMIISLLGDAFDEFQLMAEVYNYKEMAEVILEIEQIKSVIKKDDDYQYLHACVHAYDLDTNVWKGKVVDLRDYINQVEGNIKESLKENNKIIEEKIQQCLKDNDGDVENDLKRIGAKVDAIESDIAGMKDSLKTILSILHK